ncbi:MAG: hypothetical protein JOZ90_04935 [Alphaproteobacteria bacterium]|nr:hypothetical protein [Alphaproteobacteria bacterium]MBV9371929.1 hypothetical protein [Alphaproteobacteria bacterium]MBV9900426.1 hypothetical protein [Alphaproteobacteria bacterium]
MGTRAAKARKVTRAARATGATGAARARRATRAARGRHRPPSETFDWTAWAKELAEELVGLGLAPAEAEAEAALKVERTQRRVVWAEERMKTLLSLQEAAGQAYRRYMAAHPEIDWSDPDSPEVPEPPEEAAAQAAYAEIRAAIDHDRWPRHLHFPEI